MYQMGGSTKFTYHIYVDLYIDIDFSDNDHDIDFKLSED